MSISKTPDYDHDDDDDTLPHKEHQPRFNEIKKITESGWNIFIYLYFFPFSWATYSWVVFIGFHNSMLVNLYRKKKVFIVHWFFTIFKGLWTYKQFTFFFKNQHFKTCDVLILKIKKKKKTQSICQLNVKKKRSVWQDFIVIGNDYNHCMTASNNNKTLKHSSDDH